MLKVYRKYIRLADGVWDNENMLKAAQEFAADHKELRPLIVHVDEHAGWFLSYLFGARGIKDGEICGTANDGAQLSPAVLRFDGEIDEIETIPGTLTYPYVKIAKSAASQGEVVGAQTGLNQDIVDG